MKEKLVLIEIDRATTDLPAQDRKARLPAVILVHLGRDILVHADAYVGRIGADQAEHGIVIRTHGLGDAVIHRLGARDRDGAEIEYPQHRTHGATREHAELDQR